MSSKSHRRRHTESPGVVTGRRLSSLVSRATAPGRRSLRRSRVRAAGDSQSRPGPGRARAGETVTRDLPLPLALPLRPSVRRLSHRDTRLLPLLEIRAGPAGPARPGPPSPQESRPACQGPGLSLTVRHTGTVRVGPGPAPPAAPGRPGQAATAGHTVLPGTDCTVAASSGGRGPGPH